MAAGALGRGRPESAAEAMNRANQLRLDRAKRMETAEVQTGIDALLVGPYALTDVDWWPFKLKADRERLRDGLRLAGVPESGGAENVSPLSIPGAETVDSTAAYALYVRGVTFVDVRGKASWSSAHIPGAVNLDLKTDFEEAALSAEVTKDQPVVIYCAGPRCLLSSQACAKAIEWGFEKVYYYREGFPSWKASGYPIKSSKE